MTVSFVICVISSRWPLHCNTAG